MLILALLSFCVHLIPLSFSAYPFNNDSLVEGRVARQILDTGEIALPWGNDQTTTHSESTPAWNLVLAFFGGVLGMDPMFASQWAVAAIAPVAALTVYLLLVNMCGDRKSAVMGSLFITFFGTFLYLTASGWKESLGIALYFLLIYSYTRRNLTSMKLLMILVLVTLPFVHHLIAIVSYMTIFFLTAWSVIFAATHRMTRRRHFEEIAIIALFSMLAIGYYSYVSFDKLSYIGSAGGLVFLVAAMGLFFVCATAMLMLRSHVKWSFAPAPAAFILVLALLDYNGFIFDYTPSISSSNYYLIAIASAVMLLLGWYGLESIIESQSRFRAIPLAMLLPSLSLMFFALLSPTVVDKHQLVYRTFDLADPAIALGIGLAFYSLFSKKRIKRYAPAILAVAVGLLLVTVPYGLYTEEFTGVRHDTQAYEIDAFDWIMGSRSNESTYVITDERLSYVAWTVYDFGKDNRLPYILVENNSLAPGVYNIFEEFWSTRGVNDFPRGLSQPSEDFMNSLLYVENVFYIGGPDEDQLIIIHHSWIGQIYNNWYYQYP
ncbi:MAG: hypothetical protein A3K60_07355 [Euryarchaeota archaeon RBG_19FT_COMBO_56_21]|nr:MAG: hypothetical protein A3K60_07355 [Euryarchaeota archaeon RBG_19FT_COMBO_56_21]